MCKFNISLSYMDLKILGVKSQKRSPISSGRHGGNGSELKPSGKINLSVKFLHSLCKSSKELSPKDSSVDFWV